MTIRERLNQDRCKGCPFAKTIYTGPAVGYENGRQWTFTGCTHAPYRGKWVKEIEKCPKEPQKEEEHADGA